MKLTAKLTIVLAIGWSIALYGYSLTYVDVSHATSVSLARSATVPTPTPTSLYSRALVNYAKMHELPILESASFAPGDTEVRI